MVRRYVEDRLLNTSRRYVKKFGEPSPDDSVVGFTNFAEVCRELDGIVNVLWLSGTRELPFFLQNPCSTESLMQVYSITSNSILIKIGK